MLASGAIGVLLFAMRTPPRPFTLLLPTSLLLAAVAWSVQPAAFVFDGAAKPTLRSLWSTSLVTRREQVACLGGVIERDTVRVTRAFVLPDLDGDSLSASAEASLEACGAPEWIGTAHTHIRATDGDEPPARFSSGDRAVMSAWSARWSRPGAFCVLYSEKGAHCEVYPPR